MDELNVLPQGWKLVKLGDLYEITSSKRVFESEWKKNGIPFYRAREIVKLAQQGFVDNELFISDDMYNQFSEKYGIPKEGDIMITGVGTLGICYVVKSDDKFYFKDGNVIWLKRKNDINSQFIELAFKTDFLRKQIDDSVGATVGTYTIIKAKNTLIPFPPPLEQQRLATLLTAKLSLIEQAKEKVTAQLQAAQELTAAYLREVFESEEAKGWEWVKFEDIADFKNGINFNASQKGSGLLTIDVLNMYSNSIYIENDNDFYRISGEINKEYLLNDNDILFVRSSVKKEGVGWTTLFKTHSENVTFCGFIIRARIKVESYQEFIVLYFRSPLARQEIIGKAGSSTITNISQEHLKSFLVPLPPPDKQKQLANYLSEKLATVEQLKATLQTQLDSINQLPAALLKQAFSGKL